MWASPTGWRRTPRSRSRLVGRPELAILDELTPGLDPQSRRETWRMIEGIRDEGLTVILETHFMEEADYLCDRVVLGCSTSSKLKSELGRAVPHRGQILPLGASITAGSPLLRPPV